MQSGGPKTTRLFVKSRRVLSNFSHLIYYNFCYIFRKIAKLNCLEASQWSLKTSQKSWLQGHQIRRNGHLKNENFCCFWRLLFPKQKQLTSSIFDHSNISANVYHFQYLTYIRELLLKLRTVEFAISVHLIQLTTT